MVEYLESVHQGEFFDGKLEDVIERIDGYQKNPEYVPPTKTMPKAPPPLCAERNAISVIIVRDLQVAGLDLKL